MKKLKIPLIDLLTLLEAYEEIGTKDLLLYEENDQLIMCDADEEENKAIFANAEDQVGEGELH